MDTPNSIVPAQQTQLLDKEIDLHALWRVLMHRRWSIISLTIVVAMLATLIVLSVTPIYRATSTLLIEPRKNQVVSAEEIFGLDTSRGEYLATQFELLKSRELVQRIVLENKLTEHPELTSEESSNSLLDWRSWVKKADIASYLPITLPEDLLEPKVSSDDEKLEAVIQEMKERILVTPVTRTQLVKINVEMADATTATKLANALAQGYIESQLEARLQMTDTATSWMNQRLGELKTRLQTSERKLQDYRERENLVDVKGVTTLSAESLSDISSRLTDARKDRAGAESQYRQVRAINRNDLERLSSVPAVLSNPLIQEFKAEQARAQSKLQELSRRYGPKHPKMISAQSELRSATSSLRSQVDQVVASIEKNYQLAKANVGSLNSTYQANKGEIQDISRKEFKLRELQLEVDTNRSLYNTFVSRLKETSATSDLEAANARIVDRAVVPSNPVKPRKGLIVMLSALLALMAGVGMTLLIEAFDNTFKTSTQVEEHLNLPVLGNVPLIKGQGTKAVSHLFLSKKEKGFSEAIRGVRTGIMLSAMDSPKHLIMITSSIPGEGKSAVASNLALSLSQMKSTLLIDADMRRPTVGKNFGLTAGAPGLANLVAGNAKLEECLHEKDGLNLLGAGTVPPNPLELLSSPRYGKVLEVLRDKFDYVVVDSPPVQAVSDPLMIAKHADMLLYVIKSDSTHIDQIEAGIGQILQNKMRITGVVLNQLDLSKAQYYSYRYGGKYSEYYT